MKTAVIESLTTPISLALASCSLALAAPLIAGPASDAEVSASAVPVERAQIETGLIPAVTILGEEDKLPTIAERQASQGVPAVSVAVMRKGTIHWRGFYGEEGGPDTLFQAASMSKGVAAVGIVALAMERGVSIDADITADLAGLIDPRAFNPGNAKVTLRGLLSHTNGTSVSGFPGYAEGEAVPTTLGVVLGAGGANTDPVMVDPAKIGEFGYSGGGYTLAQLWAETVSGESFAALMDRLVLAPVGMRNSSFAMTPPYDDVARAYDGGNAPAEGGWNTYPESAAAGLWTTPADYAHFAHALMRASKGDGSAGIDPAVADEVLTVIEDEYGLGIGVIDDKGELRFSHSGGNRGYRTRFNAYPAREEVVVVMTNAPGGWTVLQDIMRTAQTAYGWPSGERVFKQRHALSADELEALAGGYAREGEEEVAVRFDVDGLDLIGRTPRGYTFRMVPIGPDRFIDPDEGGEIEFRQESGVQVMTSEGQRFIRRGP